jgi:hypothetical protein
VEHIPMESVAAQAALSVLGDDDAEGWTPVTMWRKKTDMKIAQDF